MVKIEFILITTFLYIFSISILGDNISIILLDESLIDKIAAGEVIERPASIVKELIENSIDADASEILIEANEGGKSLIKVSDNGIGMDEKDARICWHRHSTSKISKAEDLFSINTLGFREKR
jgi:DNA mismatch repair protein MutL